MDQLARAAVDQRQGGGDGGMGGRAEREDLDEGDAQHHARLGIMGQRLAGGGVDQRVEIREVTERFGGGGVDQGAVGRGQALGGAVQREFQRIAPAQYGIEQAQGRAAGGEAGGVFGAGWARHGRRLGQNGMEGKVWLQRLLP